MLILAGTNDRIQIALSVGTSFDAHATWVDTATGVITPGRLNLTATAPGFLTIGPAPPGSTQRNVKTLHMRNKSAIDATLVVQHTDGTITSDLFGMTLRGGQALQYTDQGGFRVL